MNITRIVEMVAQEYELSEHTIWQHAKANRLLGVTYRDGKPLFQYGGGHSGLQGPVPAQPTDYLLPVGTVRVWVEEIAGEVTGPVYQGRLTCGKKATIGEFSAACSGVIVSLHTVRERPSQPDRRGY